jgi:hypothetical protein
VRKERIEKYYNANGTDEFVATIDGKISALQGIDYFIDNISNELIGDNNEN